MQLGRSVTVPPRNILMTRNTSFIRDILGKAIGGGGCRCIGPGGDSWLGEGLNDDPIESNGSIPRTACALSPRGWKTEGAIAPH